MRIILMLCLFHAAVLAEPTEAEYNRLFCESVNGKTETKHYYTYGEGRTSYVLVDCETDTMVWEGGLDRRSSLDSVQQVLFFSALTGKKPGVVIYNTDGVIGQYEHRISQAAKRVGIQITIIQPGTIK